MKDPNIEGMTKMYGPLVFSDNMGGTKIKTKYTKLVVGKPFNIKQYKVFQTNADKSEEVFESFHIGYKGYETLEIALVEWMKEQQGRGELLKLLK